jgi:hypothetical protein
MAPMDCSVRRWRGRLRLVNRKLLLAKACRPGTLLGLGVIVLLAVGTTVMTTRPSTAQYPMDTTENPVVPVPGATPHAARLRGQVPCEQIISNLDRNTRPVKGRAANTEGQKQRAATVAMLAKRMGTTQLWVTQCMRAYGRRVPAVLENVQNEDVVEEFEEQEPEESAADDLSEPGGRERDPIRDENSQDRQRLRAENPTPAGEERERVLHVPAQGSQEERQEESNGQ